MSYDMRYLTFWNDNAAELKRRRRYQSSLQYLRIAPLSMRLAASLHFLRFLFGRGIFPAFFHF